MAWPTPHPLQETGWGILVWPGMALEDAARGGRWAPWGIHPPPRIPSRPVSWAYAGCREKGYREPGTRLLPAQVVARGPVLLFLSPPAEIPSAFPASQGIPGVSMCPWATFGDLRHFLPNSRTIALDQGVRSGCKGEELPGRQGLSCGIWVGSSGTTTIHPLLLLWVTQSLGLCLGFPGPGAGDRDGSTSACQLSGRESVSLPAFWVSTEERVTGVGVQRSPRTAASWSGVPGDLWLC